MRRHRQDHGVVRAERHGIAAEIELGNPVAGNPHRPQLVIQPHCRVALAQMLDRGLDQHRAQPIARDQRPACLAASRQRLAHHRRRQRSRALARLDVQRRQQQRMHQPLVQRPRAVDHLRDRHVALRQQQSRQPQILGQPGARHPAGRVENPPRQAVVDPQASSARRWCRSTNGNSALPGPTSPAALPIASAKPSTA